MLQRNSADLRAEPHHLLQQRMTCQPQPDNPANSGERSSYDRQRDGERLLPTYGRHHSHGPGGTGEGRRGTPRDRGGELEPVEFEKMPNYRKREQATEWNDSESAQCDSLEPRGGGKREDFDRHHCLRQDRDRDDANGAERHQRRVMKRNWEGEEEGAG